MGGVLSGKDCAQEAADRLNVSTHFQWTADDYGKYERITVVADTIADYKNELAAITADMREIDRLAVEGRRKTCTSISYFAQIKDIAAKYRAEPEPVDPFILEARELTKDFFNEDRHLDLMAGKFDHHTLIQRNLKALRRGAELAQGGAA